jgi:hypothetical protein
VSNDDERVGYLAGDGGTGLDATARADLDELRRLLADPNVWVEPPPELEAHVVDAVLQEAARRPATPSAPSTVVPIRRAGHRRRRIAAVAVVLVAAAVVALVVGLTGTTGRAGTRIALAPTDLVPGAHGTATVTPRESGLEIHLRATGLPRRDGGLYYQAWLKNAAGVLVPIGTFHDGNDVTLWAGVRLEDFPTLTVTEQQADNNQASSGRRVLVGTAST